jgi:hydroxyacylglutathione hydrolase
VALHGADAELLAQRRAHLNGYAGVRFRYLDAPELLAQTEALLLEGISGELADGDRIPLGRGITLAVVHTPGHSAGSVSYLLEGPNWAFTGDAVQIHGSGTNRFPLFVDPAAYRASLRRLLAEVRPAELYLGHRLLDPTGETLLESHLAGEAVPAALRGSLDVEERLAAAAAQIAVPAQQPLTAQSFAPAAEALGYRADDPLSWPPSFFATLSGYLAPSESGPPAR